MITLLNEVPLHRVYTEAWSPDNNHYTTILVLMDFLSFLRIFAGIMEDRHLIH